MRALLGVLFGFLCRQAALGEPPDAMDSRLSPAAWIILSARAIDRSRSQSGYFALNAASTSAALA